MKSKALFQIIRFQKHISLKDNVHIKRVAILYKLSLSIEENTGRNEIQDNYFCWRGYDFGCQT